MKANLDSTRLMLEKIRSLNYPRPPVLLYTSSGAVYGGDLPNGTITDDTVPMPQGSYGIQKLVGLDLWAGPMQANAISTDLRESLL